MVKLFSSENRLTFGRLRRGIGKFRQSFADASIKNAESQSFAIFRTSHTVRKCKSSSFTTKMTRVFISRNRGTNTRIGSEKNTGHFGWQFFKSLRCAPLYLQRCGTSFFGAVFELHFASLRKLFSQKSNIFCFTSFLNFKSLNQDHLLG